MGTCCKKCFDDDHIASFIEGADSRGDCDYCRATNVWTAETDAVGEFVREGLSRGYKPATSAVQWWDKDTDVWDIGTSAVDVLLEEGVFSDRLGLNEARDLAAELFKASGPPAHAVKDGDFDELEGGDALMVGRSYNEDPSDSHYQVSWEAFKHSVKHSSRFFDLKGDRSRESLLQPLTAFFDRLQSRLRKGARVFRARMAEQTLPNEASELQAALGPPPTTKSKHNRMSPAGISYFYGASDLETCVAEIRPPVGSSVWVAEFVVEKQLRLLDLTSVPTVAVSSIFDPKFDHNIRWARQFFRSFEREIGRPVLDAESALDYVPTQVLAEFVRSRGLHGIKFHSSQSESGLNYVLFCGPPTQPFLHPDEDYAGVKGPPSAEWLRLERATVHAVRAVRLDLDVQSTREVKARALKRKRRRHQDY